MARGKIGSFAVGILRNFFFFLLTSICTGYSYCGEADKGIPLDKPVETKEYQVVVKPSAALRSRASLNSRILVQIPFGTEVEILGEDKAKLSILGKTGKWLKISTGERSGWIFSPLVSRDKVSYRVFGEFLIDESNFKKFSDSDRKLEENCTPDGFPEKFKSGWVPGTFGGMQFEADGKYTHVINAHGLGERGTWEINEGMVIAYGSVAGGSSFQEICEYDNPYSDCENRPREEVLECCTKRMEEQQMAAYGKVLQSYSFVNFLKHHQGRVYLGSFSGDPRPVPGKDVAGYGWKAFSPICLKVGFPE